MQKLAKNSSYNSRSRHLYPGTWSSPYTALNGSWWWLFQGNVVQESEQWMAVTQWPFSPLETSYNQFPPSPSFSASWWSLRKTSVSELKGERWSLTMSSQRHGLLEVCSHCLKDITWLKSDVYSKENFPQANHLRHPLGFSDTQDEVQGLGC